MLLAEVQNILLPLEVPRWTVLGLYTGKWMTTDEFMLLPTASSSYHRFIYEFKGIPAAKKGRKRSIHDQWNGAEHDHPTSCFCDATEAGNVTRDINHFSRVLLGDEPDEDASLAFDEGHASASARFVQTIDERTGLPHILVVALRDLAAGEEVVIDYGADYFTNINNMEETEELRRQLEAVEAQLKGEIAASRAVRQELDAALMGINAMDQTNQILNISGP